MFSEKQYILSDILLGIIFVHSFIHLCMYFTRYACTVRNHYRTEITYQTFNFMELYDLSLIEIFLNI